jgi:beta-mannosidase
MAIDPLAGAKWECCSTTLGAADGPDAVAKAPVEWWPLSVPGTAASALREVEGIDPDGWDYDGRDWWFRARFSVAPGRYVLRFGGLATIADVWLNGALVLHSENMFRAHTIEVDCADGDNELLLRCGALTPVLQRRFPRPRWRTLVTAHRNLRWVRTSLMGRTPGWTLTPPIVGPWRPIELWPAGTPRLLYKRVVASCEGASPGGTVTASFRFSGELDDPVVLDVAGSRVRLDKEKEPGFTDVHGVLHLDEVDRWWPATLGAQALYPVTLAIGQDEIRLSPVGFRTIEVDTSTGGFAVSINGVDLFCRGAVWWPTDSLAASSSPGDMRAMLCLAREANMNMVRICGLGTYETEAFWELCDELGLLVWQDCMIAFGDPPDDDVFVEEVVAEFNDNLAWLGGHPSLAVLCGSLQVHEQAAFMTDRATAPECRVLDDVLPALAAEHLPGTPYVPSTPSGGKQPFYVNEGIGNYYGVGMYLRDPVDARLSGVRFATECLFMATPPDPLTVELCGGADLAGHHPDWKKAVHYDPGRSWDKEDVRSYYVRRLFGLDPAMLRHTDAERALDAGRACNAHLVNAVFGEWRRVGSACRGGMVLGLRDQRRGAGWGLVDAYGRPKSTWYAFRRVAQPLAVLITDEGLQGLAVHVLNETRRGFAGRLQLQMFARGAVEVASEEVPMTLGPGESAALSDVEILGGFRDANYVYRFGPPQHDLVVATLCDSARNTIGQAFHFPLGVQRPVDPQLGLAATAWKESDGSWSLEITSSHLAQWVVPSVVGYRSSDAWFHLAPGRQRRLKLEQVSPEVGEPRGVVRAWNSESPQPISLLQ